MRKWLLVSALAALSAVACGRDHPPRVRTELDPKDFIAVMTALGNSQPHQRAAILKRHQVTDQELRDFVAAYSKYPQAFSVILDTVQAHLANRYGPPGPL